MSNKQKVSTTEKKAGTTLNETMLKTFKGVDGKEHNVKWLATQAVQADTRRIGIAENMLKVAVSMSESQFKDFDKDVRASMKWGKAPSKANDATKALYGATPRTWKNAVSVINQCFTHAVDLKQYETVFGKGGLNDELKARKDALGANNTATPESKKVMDELYPEIQGAIMHITALDTAIKSQPDASTLLELAMVELNDAIERVQGMLAEGTVMGDEALAEIAGLTKDVPVQSDKNASKQAQQ